MSRGTYDVCLQIVHSSPLLPSGSGIIGRGLASLGRFGGAFRIARGGGERLCTMSAGSFLLRPMPHANSSLLYIFGASSLHHSTMLNAKTSLLGPFGAFLLAASPHFLLRAMPLANSSLSGCFGAPLVAANGFLRTMRDANPSPNDMFSAPLVAASLHLCTMFTTDTPLYCIGSAPLMAAEFFYRTMPPTDTSLSGIVGAPLVAALLHHVVVVANVYFRPWFYSEDERGSARGA